MFFNDHVAQVDADANPDLHPPRVPQAHGQAKKNQPGIRASKFRTVDGCQAPPRAVRTPRALGEEIEDFLEGFNQPTYLSWKDLP